MMRVAPHSFLTLNVMDALNAFINRRRQA